MSCLVVLHCSICYISCVVLHCCVLLFRTVLHGVTLYCAIFCIVIIYCAVLYGKALHCVVLRCYYVISNCSANCIVWC